MVKRKVSIEVDTPIEKKKKVSVSTSDEQKGSLDCTDATKLMQSLLGSTTIDEFKKSYWEKKPLLIKRDDPKFYAALFTLSTMKEILKANELEYLSDVNVCRYVNGEKELLNEEGQITGKDVDRLIDEKQATFQFYQPQRYVDELWNIMEKMETFFGSLVGGNVYITPPGAQGLAPHCDDVEIFVMQLEGQKTWKLYEPMVQLSRDYTQDLLQESIGKPIMEVTLEPGDLLYFPRGTIHQAKTVSSSHSTHISMSTYQQNTWGDFMNHAVKQAIEKAIEDDVTIRSGLPWRFLSILGTEKNMGDYVEDVEGGMKSNLNDKKVKDFKKTVQDHLSKLVDHIDVNTAADSMSADFMTSRLPPFGHVVCEDDDECILPNMEDMIKIRYPEHVRIVYCDEDEEEKDDDDDDDEEEEEEEEEEVDEEMDEDEKPAKPKDVKATKSPKATKKAAKTSTADTEEDDEDDEDAVVTDTEPYIKILHSLNNDRFSHMGGDVFDDEVSSLKLHVSFAKAAIELLKADDYISVNDLKLEDETDKLTLAATLFSDDLIDIKSPDK